MEYLELESERLLFRKYAKEDFPVFYDMLSNLENMKYRSSEPKDMDAVQKYLDWGMKCAEQSPCINFRYAVVLKETGEVIGSCELAYTNKDPAELAWELHRNYWRKGYGTEIGKTLLKLGFETLGLRRIIADCNTLNKGSYGIMEKIGMRREAHYVKYYRGNSALNHEWCDKYLYAILSEEYFRGVAGECEKEIEFKKFTDFNRGIMYEILKDAYSFDERCAICWDENWKQSDAFFFDNPDIADKYGFVTCYRGEPIGFICWDPRNRPEYVEIGHNGIRTKYKGKGFGKAQLSEALRRIKEYTGLKEIRVWTNSNLIAPRNYESVGFVLYDTKENNDEAAFSGDYLYYKIQL